MVDYNTAYTELTVTTLNNNKYGKWHDNMSESNALMYFMKKDGNLEEESGGDLIKRDIYAPLSQSNYRRYSGFDTLNINPTDGLTTVTYDWKQAATSIVYDGRTVRLNGADKERIQNYVQSKVKLGKMDAQNRFNQDLHSAGTELEQVGGLQFIVSDAGTGTVGGINSSTYSWWQNLVQSAAAPLGGGSAVTPSATTIEPLMRGLYNRLCRGQDKPKVILSDLSYYEFYETSLREDQRFMNPKVAEAGFTNVIFKNTPVVLENSESSITANRMYFLNTDFLKLVVHKDAKWTPQADRAPVNQDAIVKHILWMGNLVCTNRSLQGVLKP